MENTEVTINEETLFFDLNSIIGAIGGCMSLFVGFSPRVRLPLSDFSAIYWGYFTGQFSLVTILGFFGNFLVRFKVPQYRNVHSGNSGLRQIVKSRWNLRNRFISKESFTFS